MKGQKSRGAAHKHIVLTLVQRDGEARSFHIEAANYVTVVPIVNQNIHREAHLMSDGATYYRPSDYKFAERGVVNHTAGEYARRLVHTNTLEGYFSIFKRGMKGVYQHCSEKDLHRYLAEFDFRYSNRVKLGCNDERGDPRGEGCRGQEADLSNA